MKKALVLFVFAGTAFLASCSKEEDTKDTTRPMVRIESPGDDTLRSGEILAVRVLMSDNEELSQVKFEVHDNFDGHSHLKKAGSPVFTWDSIINLSGKNAELVFNVQLPEDVAAGKYDFLVMALDKSGNEAELAERELFIVNVLDEEEPQFAALSFTPALMNGEIHLENGESEILVNATATDNLGLDKVIYRLIRESDEKEMWESETSLNGTSSAISQRIELDQAWGKGHYELLITLVDETGNRHTEDIHVHLD